MSQPPISAPISPRISVVVAVQFAQANLPAILAALGPGMAAGRAEVLVCHAADDPVDLGPVDLGPQTGLRVLTGEVGALIPELWRDGILAAGSAVVATLTAHCLPEADWLDVACGLDMAGPDRTGLAGIGGLIVSDPDSDAPGSDAPGSDPAGAAIHLLRYHAYATAQAPRAEKEIAADNALYLRAEILACDDLLPGGFWEPAFHARFRLRGLGLELHPALVVSHANRYTPGQFMRQRRRHGYHFGLSRALAAPPARRWLMLLTSPAAFPVFAIKLTRSVRRDPVLRRGWLRAAPWLYLFMANWCWGEMRGYAAAVAGKRR